MVKLMKGVKKLKKYCGVVVFYNPEVSVLENINTYINDLEKLYVVDNSNQSNKGLIDKIKSKHKVTYIHLRENKGLAYALNEGCGIAIEDGFDYCLTMDQDSRFETGSVRIMKDFIEQSNKEYAIIAPNVKSIYYDDRLNEEMVAYTILKENDSNRETNWVMTSGSLMSLRDYSTVNGFDNDLFIAHIDIDIGLKFAANNKKIIQLKDALIYQRFGNSIPKKILWKTVHPSFADPVRTYYLFRNQKYLEEKYTTKMKSFIGVNLYKFVVKIVMFEPQKIMKLKMGLRGIIDARKGNMGKFIN